ncbi:hypothetical protein [Hymenobacter glacieicola]|uniref:Phage tail collar domain-containing protein n=1 Tax=Hymenobacter glacieicola TaxID=1562124 RepID=A0ABQ1WLA9_9BACT|nr:hypothetical protein [Hymenobacter glacieicola]GGG33534.1 hypothetical protein GCM10011378_07490 [Hymenobacter glacieicola]
MRKLKLEEGGRPLTNDDFKALQDDMYYAAEAAFQNLPPHIVANVNIYPRGGLVDVGYGIVWLGGELLKFDGASGVSLPCEIVLDNIGVYDQRAYQTGGTKDCIIEQRTKVQAKTTDNIPKISITADGALRYSKVMESRFRVLGEVQWLANINTGTYDVDGKGIPGTEAHGWALCNGNVGTADLRGMFVVGQDPARADYDVIGDTGGEEMHRLTTAEMPSHNHAKDGQFEYNQLLRKAPYGSKTTAASTDGTGNGGQEPDITTSMPISPIGGDQPHENRPPFYVLAVRQWIGL